MNRLELEAVLKKGGIENYRFEAKELLNAFKSDVLDLKIKQRLSGVPLQYLLGEWEFYSLPMLVGSGVLIPRPETELLIDIAKTLIDKNSVCIDLCSGSGAIAITINKTIGSKTYALEKYEDALSFLEKNIALNGADVTIIKEDVFKFSTDLKFDLIISNPPYIKTDDLPLLQKEVSFEPKTALDGGKDGLMFYKHISSFKSMLKENGAILFEVGFDQADDVCEILTKNGFKTKIFKDLSGVQRAVLGTLTH